MDETRDMLCICLALSCFLATPKFNNSVYSNRNCPAFVNEQGIKGNDYIFMDYRNMIKISRYHRRSRSLSTSSIPQDIRRHYIYHDLPPPQPRAHTWGPGYPVSQSDDELDELNCTDGWVRQRSEPVRIISKKHQKLFGNKKRILQKLFGNKILHKILHKPHSQIVYNHASTTFNPNRWSGYKQTTATNPIIGYPVPPSKTATEYYEDVSAWDALLVYDTYGLGRKIFERYKRIPLRYGWLFGCN